MMVDQSRRKGGWGNFNSLVWCTSRHRKRLPVHPPAEPRALIERHLVAQRGVADARPLLGLLVGQRTGGLVAVAAALLEAACVTDIRPVRVRRWISTTPVFVGCNELKDGLCRVDGNGSSIHVGLLFLEDLIPTPVKTGAPMRRKQAGESSPSGRRDAPAGTL